MSRSTSREVAVPSIERRASASLTTSALSIIAAYRVPLTAFVVHLVLVFAIAALAMHRFYTLEPVAAIDYQLPALTGLEHYLVQPLRNWDGFWYSLIVEYGYRQYAASAAFWPLYPVIVRFGVELTGWSIPIVGIIVSNTAFLFALGVLYRLVMIDYPAVIARRSVWLLALFPTSYYFSAVYTESLFLLTTVSAVYFGRTERWGRAAIALSLAALTRNTGVLVIIALGLLLVQQRGWHPRGWWPQAVQLGAAALSPLIFMVHLNRIWNNPLLTLDAQKDWARYRAWPWETVAEALRQADFTWLRMLLDNPSISMVADPNVRLVFAEGESYDVITFFVFIPITIYMLYRVRPAYSLYALTVFILPLFSPSEVHPLMSIPRFVIVLFPFFIALAQLLRNRWLFYGALALSVLQFAGLLIQFSTWFWVA